MKKWLKVLLWILGIVVLLILGFVAFIQFKSYPVYEVTMPPELQDLEITPSPELIARGKDIGEMMCKLCHMGPDGKLSGLIMEEDGAFGRIAAPNITQHKTYGIGDWTDGELYYLLRTRIKPDGKLAYPPMSAFAKMADEDLKAVIAWLRSDDPIVQASDHLPPPSKPSLLFNVLANMAFSPVPYPNTPISIPDTNNLVAYGAYLANDRAHCYNCHSADFATNDEVEPEKSVGFYGGGTKVHVPGKDIFVFSPNITFDEEDGIGKRYTEADFIRALKKGIKPEGDGLQFPMPTYTMLSEHDLKAIYAYLKTVPKISNNAKAGAE